MKVEIIETKSKSVVATVPVSLGGLNYKPSHSELYDEAWQSAVEDGLVGPDKKADYEFQVALK